MRLITNGSHRAAMCVAATRDAWRIGLRVRGRLEVQFFEYDCSYIIMPSTVGGNAIVRWPVSTTYFGDCVGAVLTPAEELLGHATLPANGGILWHLAP